MYMCSEHSWFMKVNRCNRVVSTFTHSLKEAESWESSEHVQMNNLNTLLSTEALLRSSRICGKSVDIDQHYE